MTTPVIIRFDAVAEYYFKERCYIIESWNSLDDPALSIARARIEPGVTTRRHRLNGVTERYVILEGRGYVEVGELAGAVAAGDVVVIPPGLPQRITNTGDTDLVFLALCTPRFTQSVYEDIATD